MELKEWIRTAREAIKKTQTDFGESLGVGKQNVSAWENGRHEPSVSQVLKIARMTNTSPALLDDWPADFRVSVVDESKGGQMNGWPLSPELLAALQNADPRALKRAKVALMSALDVEFEVVAAPAAQETSAPAA